MPVSVGVSLLSNSFVQVFCAGSVRASTGDWPGCWGHLSRGGATVGRARWADQDLRVAEDGGTRDGGQPGFSEPYSDQQRPAQGYRRRAGATSIITRCFDFDSTAVRLLIKGHQGHCDVTRGPQSYIDWPMYLSRSQCSGNALVSINAVALHRARLVLEWVNAFGQVNYLTA